MKATAEQLAQDKIMLRISVCITKFFKNYREKYSIQDAVEDYVTVGETKKKLEKIYLHTTGMFKDSKKITIRGKKHTLIRKQTNMSNFDKETFIADYGIETYNKYMKPVPRYEFVIVDNNTLDLSVEEEKA